MREERTKAKQKIKNQMKQAKNAVEDGKEKKQKKEIELTTCT